MKLIYCRSRQAHNVENNYSNVDQHTTLTQQEVQCHLEDTRSRQCCVADSRDLWRPVWVSTHLI